MNLITIICIPQLRIYVKVSIVCGIVCEGMGRNPLRGEVFIFLNKSQTCIKLLHWERGGLVLYHKRLESGRFALPRFDESSRSYRMDWHELVMMVQGIEERKISYRKRYKKLSEFA